MATPRSILTKKNCLGKFHRRSTSPRGAVWEAEQQTVLVEQQGIITGIMYTQKYRIGRKETTQMLHCLPSIHGDRVELRFEKGRENESNNVAYGHSCTFTLQFPCVLWLWNFSMGHFAVCLLVMHLSVLHHRSMNQFLALSIQVMRIVMNAWPHTRRVLVFKKS